MYILEHGYFITVRSILTRDIISEISWPRNDKSLRDSFLNILNWKKKEKAAKLSPENTREKLTETLERKWLRITNFRQSTQV